MEQKNLDLAKYKLCVLQFSWVQMTSAGYWLFGNEGLEKGHCDVLDFFSSILTHSTQSCLVKFIFGRLV